MAGQKRDDNRTTTKGAEPSEWGERGGTAAAQHQTLSLAGKGREGPSRRKAAGPRVRKQCGRGRDSKWPSCRPASGLLLLGAQATREADIPPRGVSAPRNSASHFSSLSSNPAPTSRSQSTTSSTVRKPRPRGERREAPGHGPSPPSEPLCPSVCPSVRGARAASTQPSAGRNQQRPATTFTTCPLHLPSPPAPNQTPSHPPSPATSKLATGSSALTTHIRGSHPGQGTSIPSSHGSWSPLPSADSLPGPPATAALVLLPALLPPESQRPQDPFCHTSTLSATAHLPGGISSTLSATAHLPRGVPQAP